MAAPKQGAATRSPANPERGEHELVLAGVAYRMRPSHSAIVAIERTTGLSIMDLFRAGNTGSLSLQQMGMIAGELIRTGAPDGDELTAQVDDDRIGELIYEEGVHRAMARLTLCLIDAASGGRKASGEAKAAPAESKRTAGAA
ncbi:gene transfer agent family protein [Sphingomonadales bacterium 56]|uniref:GTA-gp10 family protein n=1 Tax=Sphingobium sp. S6 TaxID=2758386 RepID=UPI001918A201|nr:GTA-gp10 family protein [Sphingobium sp. S6]MBY2927844.1 gene transfer agent family protein [Sphingomonadales bacterium 56]CAD7336052.1 hypothetical protein SPHS6_00817 [Sphingobium sp. S6]